MQGRVGEDFPGAVEEAARRAERERRVVVVDSVAQVRARARKLAAQLLAREVLARLGRNVEHQRLYSGALRRHVARAAAQAESGDHGLTALAPLHQNLKAVDLALRDEPKRVARLAG